MDYDLGELVKKVDCLPTWGAMAAKTIELCSEPQTPVSKFIDVISSDQSLLLQILRIANSSYFNSPKEITSIEKAICILGFNIVRDIVLSIAIFSSYHTKDTQPDFDFRSIWEHTFLAGLIGRALAEKFDPEKKDLLFIAGLLHDIGKLVQNQVINKDFLLIVIKSQRENEKLHIIERRILGFHHGDVGGVLLHNWNLPYILANMVKYHHHPFEFTGGDDESRMIRLCYLSNLLAHFIQNGLQNSGDLSKLDRKITGYFSFKDSEFDEIIDYTRKSIGNHKSLNQILMES